jgi:hypothetical protein
MLATSPTLQLGIIGKTRADGSHIHLNVFDINPQEIMSPRALTAHQPPWSTSIHATLTWHHFVCIVVMFDCRTCYVWSIEVSRPYATELWPRRAK